MAAPNHVRPRVDRAAYVSPPRRDAPWTADRPGEVVGGDQPAGPALGNQGPDQGYAWKLVRRFEDRLVLGDGERAEDALAGCVAVALRRASVFGRAPVVHDVELALAVLGFLEDRSSEAIEWRRDLFDEVSHPHHYTRLLAIADLVPEDDLRRVPAEVEPIGPT